jgi:hypothetical protein
LPYQQQTINFPYIPAPSVLQPTDRPDEEEFDLSKYGVPVDISNEIVDDFSILMYRPQMSYDLGDVPEHTIEPEHTVEAEFEVKKAPPRPPTPKYAEERVIEEKVEEALIFSEQLTLSHEEKAFEIHSPSSSSTSGADEFEEGSDVESVIYRPQGVEEPKQLVVEEDRGVGGGFWEC